MAYYDILLPVPAGGVYTYISHTPLSRGQRVRVPLASRILTGVVLNEAKELKDGVKYREIAETFEDSTLFTDQFLKLIDAMADYYVNPPGLTLSGTISKSVVESEPCPVPVKKLAAAENLRLNPDQQAVYESIAADHGKFSVHLIHGVTGSGKTEIYIELAKDAIAAGQKVIYLVPEISLTPQMVERISNRLGFEVPSYHSRHTPKKRKEVFWSFAKGEAPVLIGARSALFVPAENIGLIIVDEEHEQSYKQEEAPSYQLRDMAVLYGSILGTTVVLGSATPSLETMHNARAGKYRLHRLLTRHAACMPAMQTVDMKSCDPIDHIISERLYDELSATVQRGEQAILLINRKGYSHTLYCEKCGKTIHCPNCSVALTWYKSRNVTKCHYCASEYRTPHCTHCGSTLTRDYGAGTERVAEVLEQLLGIPVLKLDTDNVTSQSKLSKMLDDFRDGKFKVLVGTQLVAKGLHFPNVTLSAVLNLDNMFSLPDFRAHERAFQLLVQLSGRSGRCEKEGKVIIQTYSPEMEIFDMAMNRPDDFYEFEMQRREAFGYPPVGKLCRLVFSHSREETVHETAQEVKRALASMPSALKVMGPTQAPVYKIRNKYRYSILLKSPDAALLKRAIHLAVTSFNKLGKTAVIMKVDRDPYFFM
ncbi:primosomal protein N' [Geovibrio thiophilus]|uniref:Replication restart protein PriA n=1 Tax=Geovibrio thiophilus TaxID=139438 RepID=A0A410JZ83_9BACT|nr:primosomal protein N' [Geovibrio thiophilus]QAR33361.1 primosomal protein N' [Geovibrio thiophilus]